jgi:tetratricopeptide (TPR) repeat protein
VVVIPLDHPVFNNQEIFMLEWWNSLSNNEVSLYLVFLVALIGGVGYLIKRLLDGKTPPVNNINIGITLAEYEIERKAREAGIRAELGQAHAEDRAQLEIELGVIQQQLQDTQASYAAHIASLKERISQLEALQGEAPDALLNEAIAALKQGKTQQADELFQRIETDSEDRIKLVAEAAFQRGKIAQEAVRYRHALMHYEKAARLAPDNTLYLNDAGCINHTLALYQKAIDYYERALASDIKTYGEDHPAIAIRRNNLGEVWRALGQYDKAIDYYELALPTLEKMLGDDHPNTRTLRANLEKARTEMANSGTE